MRGKLTEDNLCQIVRPANKGTKRLEKPSQQSTESLHTQQQPDSATEISVTTAAASIMTTPSAALDKHHSSPSLMALIAAFDMQEEAQSGISAAAEVSIHPHGSCDSSVHNTPHHHQHYAVAENNDPIFANFFTPEKRDTPTTTAAYSPVMVMPLMGLTPLAQRIHPTFESPALDSIDWTPDTLNTPKGL